MTAQELKNSILQHAVQGKLVPQNPTDEPASVLLERIKSEKAQLIKDKKIKAEKPLPPITDEEIPFEIPESWVWVRLGEIVQLINGDRGKNYPSKDKLTHTGIPFISAINLNDGLVSTVNLLHMSLEQYEKIGSGKLIMNDLLFCLRGSIGKNAINQLGEGAIASSLVIWRRYCDDVLYLKFLYHYANSYLIKSEIKKYDNGTAQPNLSASNLNVFLFPLPPLAEQQRIVDKVEELMPLVEEYDKAEKELTALNAKFPEQIKKSVLQYAIQGKLVAQSKADEPASELLKRIKAEKQQLLKEKKIKAEKPLAPITEEEIPFEIPESWVWVRLGEILTVHGGKRIPKGFDWTDNPTKHIYIRVTDMKNHTILSDKLKYISDEVYEQIKRYVINKDDLYLTIAGTIGSVGSVPPMFDGMNLTENAVKLSNIQVNNKFLLKVIASEFVQNQFVDKTNKVAQPKLAIERILTTIIPLPPLAEQQRIVEKVEEVLGVCVGLKA